MDFILFPQNPYVEAKPRVVAVGDGSFQRRLGFREVRRPHREDPCLCGEEPPECTDRGRGTRGPSPDTSLLVLRLGLRPPSGCKRVSVWGPQPVRVLGAPGWPCSAPHSVRQTD